jgi:hypothetical protein
MEEINSEKLVKISFVGENSSFSENYSNIIRGTKSNNFDFL